MLRSATRIALAVVAAALLLTAGVASADARKPWSGGGGGSTTTTATTTSTTTAVTTTTTPTTTTTTTASTSGGVAIFSPLTGSATIEYKGETLSAQVSDTAPSTAASCVVDWGDGSGGTYAAAQVAPGVYRCGVVHAWTWSGFFAITVAGVDDNGVVGTAETWIYVI